MSSASTALNSSSGTTIGLAFTVAPRTDEEGTEAIDMLWIDKRTCGGNGKAKESERKVEVEISSRKKLIKEKRCIRRELRKNEREQGHGEKNSR